MGIAAWCFSLYDLQVPVGRGRSKSPGKQRLRSVEQQSGAQLVLDEQWHMLHLAGTCPSIYKAISKLGAERDGNSKMCYLNLFYTFLYYSLAITVTPKLVQQLFQAQELLEIMEGFTIDISSAMWTELMRCRREDEETWSPLTLSKVQEIVGYRVHVERDSLAPQIERM